MKHIIILMVFLSAHLSAQTLTVLYETPDALPITPYLPEKTDDNDNDKGNNEPEKNTASDVFPVRSSHVSPGKVISRTAEFPYLHSPIFLMGYDPKSLAWLKASRTQLQAIGATGFVVSVESKEQFKEIKRIAKDLELVPVSGDGIAPFIGVKHYPVLVSKNAIEQ